MSFFDDDNSNLFDYRLLRKPDGKVVIVCFQDGVDYDWEYEGTFVGPRYTSEEQAQAAIDQSFDQDIYPDPKEDIEGAVCYRILRRADGEVLSVCFQDGIDYDSEYEGKFVGDRYNTREEADRAISRPRTVLAYPEPDDIDTYTE